MDIAEKGDGADTFDERVLIGSGELDSSDGSVIYLDSVCINIFDDTPATL